MMSFPLVVLSLQNSLRAQVIPDQTLPTRVVTVDDRNYTIFDCLQVGSNVFHSFAEFNIPANGSAFFDTPAGTQNIFARVTGRSASTIDGSIGANHSANLLFLNPNGIQFGPNANLRIGGSFVGSTAESILFSEGNVFSAISPNGGPLLNVKLPVGLQLGSAPAPIQVNGSNLQVDGGQTLAFAGGDISVIGGSLKAPQGRVALMTGQEGRLKLTPGRRGGGTRSEGMKRSGKIDISAAAVVDVSGPGGGEITLDGQQVNVRNFSQLLADTKGGKKGLGITVTSDQLHVLDNSILSASSFGSGQAGDVVIQSQNITVEGRRELQDFLPLLFEADIQSAEQFGTGLFSLSFGSGNAGNINIETEQLHLAQSAYLDTSTFGSGEGGNQTIHANSVILDGAQIEAASFGIGDAGKLDIEAHSISLRRGGGIFASTFQTGSGGLITLLAQERIEIDGTTPNEVFNSGIGVNSFGPGNGGVIQIESPEISLSGGAGVGGVALGSGSGGTLILRAGKQVVLQGASTQGNNVTALSTRSLGPGPAGDIEVTTPVLLIQDGAAINTAAQSSGPAGRLTIRASQSVKIEGISPDGRFVSSLRTDSNPDVVPSGFSQPSPAKVFGQAGDLTIFTPNLAVRDGAEISVSSSLTGAKAGNLRVETNLLRLNNRGFLKADASASSGGNIEVQAKDVWLQHNSGISTNATEMASGGNILINTDTLVALDNSDITANAVSGMGGNINISTQGLFLSPESEITTRSMLGLDGEVTIETPEVDPSDSTVELSERIKVPPKLVRACRAGQALGNGQFVLHGRGGLPVNPLNMMNVTAVWDDLRAPETLRNFGSSPLERQPAVANVKPQSVVEAKGWVATTKGIQLVSPQQTSSTDVLMPREMC